jgi:endonuclease/exonuclease/phosphatase family metal-dependent hydrolase
MIGVHAKSKAPHGARSPDAAMRLAIENRRKQLAQCVWLRRRVEEHLAAGEPLIVLGDFNDGPGLDEYEKLFGRSGVEVVMGEEGAIPLHDPAARRAMLGKTGAAPTSARFWIAEEGRWMETLLDYVMVSPDLADREPRWRIWHPFDDPGCYRVPELREALLAASDHFPVTLDIDL